MHPCLDYPVKPGNDGSASHLAQGSEQLRFKMEKAVCICVGTMTKYCNLVFAGLILFAVFHSSLNAERSMQVDSDFESFWKLTRFPKRTQDAKGDMRKKYKRLVLKEKMIAEDILFASDIFAEKNKDNSHPQGMRKFLDSKENVEQYLKGDFTVKLTSVQRSENQVDRLMKREERHTTNNMRVIEL